MHRDEAGFMEVDSKASRRGKVIKDIFEACCSFRGGFLENQGIVRILEDGARGVSGKGVGKGAIGPGLKDKMLEHVGNNDEKVRGEGVALPETIATSNPAAGDAVEKDRRMSGAED
jgi:hypothetical protein